MKINITTQEELFKNLKKHQLIWNINMWQISDPHNRKVNKRLAEKFMNIDILEERTGLALWFQTGFSLKHEYKQFKTFKEEISKKITND